MSGIDLQISKVVLKRLEGNDQGTFGHLEYNGFKVFSGELPERDNKPDISCIPKGIYKCIWTYSEHFKRKMYLVTGVPNRAGIRIHPGNLCGNINKGYKAHFNGCIGLGLKLGTINNQKAILLSITAVRKFETLMQRKSFNLEII